MTRLSVRLKTIADLVDDGSSIIDVGCDHGLLDVYLATNKNCCCLATDISNKCLDKTGQNIKKYRVDDKVSVMVADGLNGIDYQNYDLVIISGMGFQTINRILKNHKPDQLIIQSNNDIEQLKHCLLKYYRIESEKIVLDNNIYYVILKIVKGKHKYKYADYVVGTNKDNLDYINFLYNKYFNIYKNMPKKYILKRFKILKRLRTINRYKKH